VRILFVSPSFTPFPGGGERYARSLALQLRARGHEVTVATSTAKKEQDLWQSSEGTEVAIEFDEGIKVIRCPSGGILGGRPTLLAWRKGMVLLSALPGDQSRMLMKMARLFPPIQSLESALNQLAGSIDLVHAFNASWEHALVAGWLFARRQGIPFMVTPFAHFGGGKRDRIALNTTMDHQRRIMSDADSLLTLTSSEADNLRQHGITPRRIEVIGGALDSLPDHLDPDHMMRKHGLSKPFALFIGRANYDKGAIHAVQAIKMLQQQGLLLTLGFIGQATPEFDRLLKSLSESERKTIRHFGILDDNEKHALLAASTMLLLPSRSDSFGIVILEAWAHGKPVVAVKAGGIPGVVDDGENGLLVEFGDVRALSQAIAALLSDGTLSRRMGQKGQVKVAKEYTWDRVADRVAATYRSLGEIHQGPRI
jgi:glycosyltransferase involved in cell wall biosynthesis